MLSHYPVLSVSLIFAMMSAALIALIRKWIPVNSLISHHEVGFPIFLQIGVIYAVSLAFTLSMVLNEVGESYMEVKRETTHLLILAKLAFGFSDQDRHLIQSTLTEYAETVINHEWPAMTHHQEDSHATDLIDTLQTIYLNIDLKSPREQAIYAESLNHFSQLQECRRMRIFAATDPKLKNPLMLLIFLGLIVVGISYFFGMDRLWAQMILTGSLVFTIVSILVIIFMLNNPFAGKFAITAKAFVVTLPQLKYLEHRQGLTKQISSAAPDKN